MEALFLWFQCYGAWSGVGGSAGVNLLRVTAGLNAQFQYWGHSLEWHAKPTFFPPHDLAGLLCQLFSACEVPAFSRINPQTP